MTKFDKFCKYIDELAPNPWIIDGVEQARPTFQLGCIIGMILGAIISYFIW